MLLCVCFFCVFKFFLTNLFICVYLRSFFAFFCVAFRPPPPCRTVRPPLATDPLCPSGTVRENLVFGTPLDGSRYRRAVTAAQLAEDIRQFDGQDDHDLGEGGVNLSGGQRQVLAPSPRMVFAQRLIRAVNQTTAGQRRNTPGQPGTTEPHRSTGETKKAQETQERACQMTKCIESWQQIF